MKAENIEFLETLRPVWERFKAAPEAFNSGHVSHDQWKELDRVQREEFWPDRYENLWCGGCVMELLKNTFNRYEAYRSSQPKEEVVQPKKKKSVKA
jgi:hypothetical protein